MNENTTGDDNVAMGTVAGRYITGNENTCFGNNAGGAITSGSNNVCIGYNAGDDALAGVTTTSNNIILGNVSSTNFECKVGLTSGSDLRDKTDIENLPAAAGLNFVKQMRPVTFVWDNRADYYEYTRDEQNVRVLKTKHDRDHSKKGTDKQVGFIAQEIKAIEESIGWTEDHVVNTKNEDSYKLMYDQLIPILVKAIQELEAEVQALKG